MTASHTDHGASRSLTLATDPALHPYVFAEAFNSGDGALLDQVYEPGAVFVPRPGEPVTGAARLAASNDFLALGVPIVVTPRHTYVHDDLALLIVDFVLEGIDPQGRPVRLAGTATDVARRGADGCWRYVIDNPFGVADVLANGGN